MANVARTWGVLALTAALLLGIALPASAGLLDGLRAYYPFDEGPTQDVYDQSGNGLNGYLGSSTGVYPNTDPDRVAGLFGQALDFVPIGAESSQDLVTLPASNKFVSAASAPLTISAWIDPDTFGSGLASSRIFTLYRDTGAASTTFSLSLGEGTGGGTSGKLGLAVNAGGTFVSHGGTTAFSATDGWHHVAVSYDGTAATLYLDGQPDKVITTPYTIPSTGIARIGAFDETTAGFDGRIDDVAAWTRALSASEVEAIYQAGQAGLSLPMPIPHLRLHYKLDETSGTTASDSSGRGNTGALTGGLDFSNDSVPGAIGNGLDFDGSNDYISVADGSGLPTTGDDFTVTTWLKVSEWDDTNLVAAYNLNGIKWNIGTHTEGNGILTTATSFGSNQAFAADSSALPDDEFVHLAVVYTASAGVANMYIDGMPVSEVSNTIWTNSDDAASFALGRRFHSVYSPNHLDGVMDDFAIFDRVLTQAEIVRAMDYGAAVLVPEPTTLILLGAGLAATALRRRKRR